MSQHRIRTEPRGFRLFYQRNWVVLWSAAIGLAAILVIAFAVSLRDDPIPGTTAAGAPIVPPTFASSTPTPTVEPTAPAGDTFPGEGEFAVGTHVEPGRYVSAGSLDKASACTWARIGDADSPSDGVLQNRSASGQTIVTIKASDAVFYTKNCQPWVRAR